ncbi:MAG: hypothetical protein H7210_03275 [Pyrinomonadaceae bacterium]|nr:hypothetical protein [Phycisphaerales bacterium]
MTRNRGLYVMALVAFVLVCSRADAHEFRTRFVRWDGAAWLPISSGTFFGTRGVPYRIRVEVGVFDDAAGAAPAGGLVGWNAGRISTTGGSTSRSPGRLSPFVFASSPDSNGLPGGDPFTCLTQINATLGTQSPAWGCSAGTPLPRPTAVVRGVNTYVQLYEFTTTPGVGSHTIAIGGNLIAATQWQALGTPVPPDCPSGTPGSIIYAPVPTAPIAFTETLRIVIQPQMQTRFAVWNGAEFVPLCDDTLHAVAGSSYRIRLQFGVFDTISLPAPAGGFVGWNSGTITTTGGTNSRTPGRLSPFNFFPGGNGAPAANPFTALTGIEAAVGSQSPPWTCTPAGAAPPPPPATIRARNTFINAYEITTLAGPTSYTLTFGGNLVAADSWQTVGPVIPPACGVPGDPDDDAPGSITYAPLSLPAEALSRTLRVQVGAPVADCLGDGVPDTCQSNFTERLYTLTGTSAGTPWSWCISSPRFPSVCNLSVPGVAAGQSALAVATAFAASINAQACCDAQLFAVAGVYSGTTYLVVRVASQEAGDTPFDLCVGPGGGPATCCPVMPLSFCDFNPRLTRLATHGQDCNANGHDDSIDIITGASADVNDDGIPDDCQPAPCPADFNHSGAVTSQDFFDFIAAFFNNTPGSDFNNDGQTTSQDFFDFIVAFFAGC